MRLTRLSAKLSPAIICALAIALCASGCAQDSAMPLHQPAASMAQQLPGLPAGEAPRGTSALMQHVFTEADQAASLNCTWEGSVLSLDGPGFAWCIVGVDIDDEPAASIALSGTLSGLHVAVSDYGNGRWKYIGSNLTEEALLALPEGDYTNASGSIFFAVIAPLAASGQVGLTLNYGVPDTDVTPPAWTDGEGIISVDASHLWVELSWHEATDSESGPVEYLVYQALSSEGIDWDNPQQVVPAGFLDTHVIVPEESTESFDYGVRARDSAGNVTTNTNFLSASFSERFEDFIFDWVPGDRFEVIWQDPLADSTLVLLGPDNTEGFPESPEGMAGMVQFSEDSAVSGVALESATLVDANSGGFLLELHNAPGQTYALRLYDSEGALKQSLGNVTPGFNGAFDYLYLRQDPASWPQAGGWQPGYRLQVDWDDVEQNIDLWVESPSYLYAGPGWTDDLAGQMTFSDDSSTAGTSTEWIGFTELAELGEYEFVVDWLPTEIPSPEGLDLTWTVFDAEDQVVMGPGTFTILNGSGETVLGEIWPIAWLYRAE
ncbi:hypothetical protein KDL29_10675 [bacterium]|nr:hypothetical protein [bacterium]